MDRALCNNLWRLRFPDAIVKVLPRIDYSGHHPILVCANGGVRAQSPRIFRLESVWLLDKSFKDVISKSWNCDMDCNQNLQLMESTLKVWKKDTFGKVRAKKREIHARLNGILKAFQNGRVQVYF